MASYRRVKTGWRAQVERLGTCVTKTFKTKAEARLWAEAKEQEILQSRSSNIPEHTVQEAMLRYYDEVLGRGRSRVTAMKNIQAAIKAQPEFFLKNLQDITTADLALWRDARSQQVSAGTVLREIGFMSPAWKRARLEWGWCDHDPWAAFKRPKAPRPRTRRSHWQEIRRILREAQFNKKVEPRSQKEWTGWAYMTALHTALRAGEVLQLSRSTVDLEKRVFKLRQHKTDRHVGPREVPLTKRAGRLLAILDEFARRNNRDNYFCIDSSSLAVFFCSIKKKCKIENYRFHDARAGMLTWQSRKTNVVDLARISGHTNINILYNTYYRDSAEDVAARL